MSVSGQAGEPCSSGVVGGAHRQGKSAVFGWLAFVVVAFGIGGLIGTKSLSLKQYEK